MLYTNFNSNWIVDLHVRAKTITHLEDNIGEKYSRPCVRQRFHQYDTTSTTHKRTN